MASIKNLNCPAIYEENAVSKKYALNKTGKKFRLLTKDMVLDDIFQELEVTKDKDGNIVDTRFPREIQEFIRGFLIKKNIEYTNTGYLSLRSACYGLSYDDRLELCRNISIKFDKDVDIENKIKKSKGFFDSLKNKTLSVVGGTALGIGSGAVLNTANPTLIPNALSEVVGNEAVKVIDSNIPGVTNTIISEVGKK